MKLTGIGMVTPVGQTAAATCAALRGGISAFEQASGLVQAFGYPVVTATIGQGDPRDDLARRMSAGAWMAIEEALDAAAIDSQRDIHVVVVLSDRPDAKVFDVEGLRAQMQMRWGAAHRIRFSLMPQGHAGGAAALAEAGLVLERSSSTAALILGVDSLANLPALAEMEKHRRLKSDGRPRGLIPGEAAIALVLESSSSQGDRETKPYCDIAGLGIARDPFRLGTNDLCLAQGLAKAIDQALGTANMSASRPQGIYCDLNGEIHRTHEWMLTIARCSLGQLVVHPADCIGDIGSASLPLYIGMIGIALKAGQLTDSALAIASSDSGFRGAVCLKAA